MKQDRTKENENINLIPGYTYCLLIPFLSLFCSGDIFRLLAGRCVGVISVIFPTLAYKISAGLD